MEHFKKLNTKPPCDSDEEPSTESTKILDNDIDYKFTADEVQYMISKLRNGQSGGTDHIVNEFIKNSPLPEIINMLVNYFNLLLETGIITSDGQSVSLFPSMSSCSTPTFPGLHIQPSSLHDNDPLRSHPGLFNICSCNARGVGSKIDTINDYKWDKDLDLFLIVESFLTDSDDKII